MRSHGDSSPRCLKRRATFRRIWRRTFARSCARASVGSILRRAMSSMCRLKCWSARARVLKRSKRACRHSRPPRLRATPEPLLGHAHHVVDGGLHEIIGKIGAAALPRHDAGAALKALQGVLVERRLTLGDARPPRRLVSRLGSTGEPGAMADTANLLEDFIARLRDRS